MRDLNRLASNFTGAKIPIRLRFGKVVSVEGNRTITVTVAGDTTPISGVRYLGNFAPRPNAIVTLLTDGVDLIALNHMASADNTFAPRANRSTTQSIPDATDTAVTFNGVNSDVWSSWSATTNPERLTCRITGRYIAVATVHFVGNATGTRSAWIEKDGTSTLARVQHLSAGAGLPTWLNLTTPPFDMSAGDGLTIPADYIRLMVRQNSGGALDLSQSSTFSPALSLIYLGA